jgi:hypothetical protein
MRDSNPGGQVRVYSMPAIARIEPLHMPQYEKPFHRMEIFLVKQGGHS